MGDWIQDHESGPLKLSWQERVMDFGSEGEGKREGWIWKKLGENQEIIEGVAPRFGVAGG